MKHIRKFNESDEWSPAPQVSGKPVQSGHYRRRETVNGVEMSVYYDNLSYHEFCLYFPQIEIGKDPDVQDQVIILSQNEDEARMLFDRAVELAEELGDPYEVYKQMEKEKDILSKKMGKAAPRLMHERRNTRDIPGPRPSVMPEPQPWFKK